MNRFPPGFRWGAATSSFQIEGGQTDGRGASIWDTFCAREGTIEDGSNGLVACDHFHRYPDDIALMKRLGLQAYRFSIAWPRILPTGMETEPNAKGLDFYDRIVDTLLEAGIEPWVTLYHWDLPQPLEDMGGWPDRRIVEPFVRFSDVMSRHLGDRVKHWITHNEPWVVSILGYQNGEHAPGRKSWPDALRAAHHVMLSHGQAVPVIRGNVPDAKVGITLNLCPADAASDSPQDAEATRLFDGFFNRWFLDPLYGRGYPEDKHADYVKRGELPEGGLDVIEPGDLDTIAVKTDFLGINYYSRAVIRAEIPEEDNHPRTVHQAPEEEWTEMGWEVHAPSLESLLVRLHEEYAPPSIFITENGASYSTPPEGARVPDVKRVRYFHDHLTACSKAIERGVPLDGYFAWSLLDNFEWAKGYTQRFGLVWVDYETQERIPKDSAWWYASTIAANAVTPVDE